MVEGGAPPSVYEANLARLEAQVLRLESDLADMQARVLLIDKATTKAMRVLLQQIHDLDCYVRRPAPPTGNPE